MPFTSHPSSPRNRRRSTRLLVALVAAGVAVSLTLSVAPALAHNVLRTTAPANHQQLHQPPAEIVLTFDEPVLPMGTRIIVNGPSGPVQQGPPKLAGSNVSQRIHVDAPAGDYTVAWRVTSDDGHPISGTFTFTASAAATGRSETSQPTTPSAGPIDAGKPGVPVWVWLAAGLVVVLTAGSLLWGFGRRRRRGSHVVG